MNLESLMIAPMIWIFARMFTECLQDVCIHMTIGFNFCHCSKSLPDHMKNTNKNKNRRQFEN